MCRFLESRANDTLGLIDIVSSDSINRINGLASRLMYKIVSKKK